MVWEQSRVEKNDRNFPQRRRPKRIQSSNKPQRIDDQPKQAITPSATLTQIARWKPHSLDKLFQESLPDPRAQRISGGPAALDDWSASVVRGRDQKSIALPPAIYAAPAAKILVKATTAIAPYSTRSRAGATVSVPLAWDELSSRIKSDHFNIRNLPARLSRLQKDPWAGITRVRQTIKASMTEALESTRIGA